jgi:hypothetical protein
MLKLIEPDMLVAANFLHFFPAWHELLKGVGWKSAKSVVSWLKSGILNLCSTGRQKQRLLKRPAMLGKIRSCRANKS